MEKIYYSDTEYVEFDDNSRKVYFMDGKIKKISKEEWGKYLLTSRGDTVEGILIWLDDNEITDNEEQNSLVRLTAGQKLTVDKKVKNMKSKRTRKEDNVKQEIIATIANALKCDEMRIENKEKLIVFTINGEEFKLNLTKTRKK